MSKPTPEKTPEQLAVEKLIHSIIDGDVDDELLQAQILSLSQFINHPSSDPSLEGFTLLHAAYAVDDEKLATFLKEQGANSDAKDALGETPSDKEKRRRGAGATIRLSSDAVSAGGGMPLAETFPAVKTMLSDDELDNLMPKWLPQEVENIPMWAVGAAIAGSALEMDGTKRKTVMIANLNNHFVGFFVDKDAKKIIYFDPAPDAVHEFPASFVTNNFAGFEVVHSASKMQTVSEEKFTDGSGAPTGAVLQTIDNNHCGRFMWFVMTGLAFGKTNLGEDGFLNFTAGADSCKVEALDREKSMQFGNRVDARLQASLRDGSERDDAKKRSDYEEIFNEVITNVFKRGEKRKLFARRVNVVGGGWGGDAISAAASAAATAGGGGGGGGGGRSFR